jgi:hypothetical protein
MENLSELIADDKLPKTRIKKVNPKYKTLDEETMHHIKLSKLNLLEEDEDLQKEE